MNNNLSKTIVRIWKDYRKTFFFKISFLWVCKKFDEMEMNASTYACLFIISYSIFESIKINIVTVFLFIFNI